MTGILAHVLHAFDAATAVVPIDETRFAATVSDAWGLLTPDGGYANGGYALGICLRAIAASVLQPHPLAVAATYLAPVRFGAADVNVEAIRTGRRHCVAEARLVQDGAERLRVVATFADLAGAVGRTEVRNAPPALPAPDECAGIATRAQVPGLTLADQLEFRYAELPGWRTGTPRGRLTDEFWMRFAPAADGTVRIPDPLALAAMVDMATPPVIDIGERGSTTIELSVHVRALPLDGWLACRASTRHVIGGYHEEDFEIWDERGQLVAQSRQLAVLAGPTPGEDARVGR